MAIHIARRESITLLGGTGAAWPLAAQVQFSKPAGQVGEELAGKRVHQNFTG